MKLFFKLCLLALAFSVCMVCNASANAPITGKWKTIDDETNEPKSIVEIFEKEGKYYGKIVQLFLKEGDNQNPTCDKCDKDDPRKDQPTLGMEIIKDLEKKGSKYGNGTILDPKNGKVYDCKLWIEDGNLMLRGYIAFFFRTQTWLRVE